MKAIVVEQFGSVVLRDLPEPPMGEYEARCKMLYGTICAGTDTHLVNGHAPFCQWVKRPFVLGHESVGQVTNAGSKVRHLKPGDVVARVGTPPVPGANIGWGGFAEVGIATDWRAMKEDGADGWQSKTVQQVIPGDIDPMVGPLFITWRETRSYLARLGVKKGDAVLLAGSGGNSLAFVSHARSLGASHVAVVGSAARKADALRAGATHVYDYRDAECWTKLAADRPAGFDAAVDTLGKPELVHRAQGALRAGGTLGIYGLDEADKITLLPQKTFTFYNGGYDEAETHQAVIDDVRAGRLNPDVWLDRSRVFTLDRFAEALAAVARRELIKPLFRLQS